MARLLWVVKKIRVSPVLRLLTGKRFVLLVVPMLLLALLLGGLEVRNALPAGSTNKADGPVAQKTLGASSPVGLAADSTVAAQSAAPQTGQTQQATAGDDIPNDPVIRGALSDKPPIRPIKETKTLTFSPSQVVIYKNTSSAPGVKLGVAEADVRVSSSDGGTIGMPISDPSGIYLTTTDYSAKSTWVMRASSSYASIGQQTVSLTAKSTDGTIAYKGSLSVEVRELKPFKIASGLLNGSEVQYGKFVFSGLNYYDGTGGLYPPSVSVEGGLSCANLYYDAGTITCEGGSLPAPNDPFSFIFENQFQRLVVGGYAPVY